MQKYLYKLAKELKVTNNYHKNLVVNSGTEIYYKLNYSKKNIALS
ncbi:plasmid maintenance protein [Borreliella burgdorferi]